MFTLAITEDGSQVFAWGKADNCAFGLRNLIGDHHYPLVSKTYCLFYILKIITIFVVVESFISHWSICEIGIWKQILVTANCGWKALDFWSAKFL